MMALEILRGLEKDEDRRWHVVSGDVRSAGENRDSSDGDRKFKKHAFRLGSMVQYSVYARRRRDQAIDRRSINKRESSS